MSSYRNVLLQCLVHKDAWSYVLEYTHKRICNKAGGCVAYVLREVTERCLTGPKPFALHQRAWEALSRGSGELPPEKESSP